MRCLKHRRCDWITAWAGVRRPPGARRTEAQGSIQPLTWPPLKPSLTSGELSLAEHLRCRILLKTVSPLNGEKFFNTRDAK